MQTTTAYPAIRYANGLAVAYPRATSPDTDWLGSVYMRGNSARERASAAVALRKMFPAPASVAAQLAAHRLDAAQAVARRDAALAAAVEADPEGFAREQDRQAYEYADAAA